MYPVIVSTVRDMQAFQDLSPSATLSVVVQECLGAALQRCSVCDVAFLHLHAADRCLCSHCMMPQCLSGLPAVIWIYICVVVHLQQPTFLNVAHHHGVDAIVGHLHTHRHRHITGWISPNSTSAKGWLGAAGGRQEVEAPRLDRTECCMLGQAPGCDCSAEC